MRSPKLAILADTFVYSHVINKWAARKLDEMSKRETVKQIAEKFNGLPQPGEYVEDCRGRVVQIVSANYESDSAIVGPDQWGCSFMNCLEVPTIAQQLTAWANETEEV